MVRRYAGEKGKCIIDLCALVEDGGLSDCIRSVNNYVTSVHINIFNHTALGRIHL